jgi:hypothetical protein
MSGGLAAGGAALGSLAGPGGAAIGGAAGVVAAELIEEETPLEAIPVDGPAATVHHVDNLVNTVGWWFLIIFVFVPLLTKKGRGWIRKFTDLHNTVSQRDIEDRAEKQDTKIKDLEERIKKVLNSVN